MKRREREKECGRVLELVIWILALSDEAKHIRLAASEAVRRKRLKRSVVRIVIKMLEKNNEVELTVHPD